MSDATTHRRFRAPRDNGGTLVDPSLSGVGEIVAANVRELQESDYDVHGRSLAQLAATARSELLAAAWRYTASYRNVGAEPTGQSTLFLAGHQPEIFHPGVWYKNFVLDRVAREHNAAAVNLVIDSDTIKSASLRVPGGSAEQPTLEVLAFDHASAEIPFEQRPVLDSALFNSFGQRTVDRLKHLVPDPLVRTYWPLVQERARQGANLGQCLAQARHQLEGEWGASTLEIPQSQVCSLPSFHWFTAHLLSQLPRVWETYNSVLLEYRRANHVRSAAHPVPELDSDGEWLEAPFWIWSDEDPRRRPLFVRNRNGQLELSDRERITFPLAISADSDAETAVEQLAALPRRGIKLRTRALLTTLMARVLLGDLFLHGIGGAKYDELTDTVITRLFGLQPPGFLVVSATLHLPVRHSVVEPAQLQRTTQQLRELEFHPERHLNGNATAVEDLLQTKRRWIDTPSTPENAKTRCREIRRVNSALQPYVSQQRTNLASERSVLAQRLRDQTLLTSREYGFCLYPADTLQQLLLNR